MQLVVIGGSDAGISAGLRARELDQAVRPVLVVADAYPNFSICGIPYHVSGDVPDWRSLAHRTRADLENAGLDLRLDTRAVSIDPDRHTVTVRVQHPASAVRGHTVLIVERSPQFTGLWCVDSGSEGLKV